MKNGNLISKLIQKLRETDKNWEICFLKEEQEIKEEILKQVNQLCGLLRQELKSENKEAVQSFLLSENIQEEVVERLIRAAQSTLECYYDFSFIRELESRDATTVKGVLSTIYQNYIVRYEPGYLNKIASASWYEEERLDAIARWLDYLTTYYISRSYTLQAMIRDLQDETMLSQESCEYFANLIEKDYTLLKMNYIADGLYQIKNSLKESHSSQI